MTRFAKLTTTPFVLLTLLWAGTLSAALPSVKTLLSRSIKPPSSQVISFQLNFTIEDKKFREVISVLNETLYRIELFDESGKLISDRLYKSQKAFLRNATESTASPTLQHNPLQPEILFFMQSVDRLTATLQTAGILPQRELTPGLEPIKLIPLLGLPSWTLGPSMEGNLAHIEQDTFRWRGLILRGKFEWIVKSFETHLKNVELPQSYSYAFGPSEWIDIHLTDVSIGNQNKLFSLEPKNLGMSDFSGAPSLLIKLYSEAR